MRWLVQILAWCSHSFINHDRFYLLSDVRFVLNTYYHLAMCSHFTHAFEHRTSITDIEPGIILPYSGDRRTIYHELGNFLPILRLTGHESHTQVWSDVSPHNWFWYHVKYPLGQKRSSNIIGYSRIWYDLEESRRYWDICEIFYFR